MGLKQHNKESMERMDAWWDREILDRPVIAYSYRKMNLKPTAHFNNWDLARDPDNIADCARSEALAPNIRQPL